MIRNFWSTFKEVVAENVGDNIFLFHLKNEEEKQLIIVGHPCNFEKFSWFWRFL